jgi:hypothetical protein
MAFSCGGNPAAKSDYRVFLPLGKEKNATAGANIAYNFLTPIYRGLTALNIPASQNFMNAPTKGSP